MNGGQSEKKEEEGLEICETGENILPYNTKFSVIKTPENEKWWKWMTIIKKKEQQKWNKSQTEKSKQALSLLLSHK